MKLSGSVPIAIETDPDKFFKTFFYEKAHFPFRAVSR